MKKVKNILFKGFFYLIALQILNLSVDVDYVVMNFHGVCRSAAFDDIDSLSEYLLEKIVGDNNYTAESDDDDEGNAQNKGIEKYDPGPFYAEHLPKTKLIYTVNDSSFWVTGLDLANKTCKGYFMIITPPPKG